MDFKGNRHELRLSLLEAFTSYLAFCEGCTRIKMLRETLENPHTHKVNAYRLMDGEADDLYYEERNNHDVPKGQASIREYRLSKATEGGFLPCFPGPNGGWQTESPKGRPGIEWGYWRLPLACRQFGGSGSNRSWAEEIKISMPSPHVLMAIEMMKILVVKLNKYRPGDDNPGEYGGELLDFFAEEAHVKEPLWDLYREVFGLRMEYPHGYDFPDCGRVSSRLKVLMDRFHGNTERRIAY